MAAAILAEVVAADFTAAATPVEAVSTAVALRPAEAAEPRTLAAAVAVTDN